MDFVLDGELEIHGVGSKTVQNVLNVMASGMMPLDRFARLRMATQGDRGLC
jgi:hypothetical protein